MSDESFFLIASLRRCGSTFLQMSLNQEEGVFCDREFVFRDAEYLQSNHIAINGQTFSICDAITSMASSKKIRGSKITIPEYQENRLEEILASLSYEPLSVIHLTRNLAHQMISLRLAKMTKVWHVLDRENQSELLPEWSKDAPGYISRDEHSQLNSVLFSLSPEEVEKFCHQSVTIDKALLHLSKKLPYMHVDLEKIDLEYSNICDFLGVKKGAELGRKKILTSKVVKEGHETHVENWTEVESIFERWEVRRSDYFKENKI